MSQAMNVTDVISFFEGKATAVGRHLRLRRLLRDIYAAQIRAPMDINYLRELDRLGIICTAQLWGATFGKINGVKLTDPGYLRQRFLTINPGFHPDLPEFCARFAEIQGGEWWAKAAVRLRVPGR